jgi:hypothetical protein
LESLLEASVLHSLFIKNITVFSVDLLVYALLTTTQAPGMSGAQISGDYE